MGVQQLHQYSAAHPAGEGRQDVGSDVRNSQIETLSEAAIEELRAKSRRECAPGEGGMEAASIVGARTRKHRSN